YAAAVFTTFIILLSLIFLNNFEKLFRRKKTYQIEITALPGLTINSVVSVFESYSLTIKQVNIERIDDELRNIIVKIVAYKEINQVELFEDIDRKSTRLNSSHVSISY